MIPSSSTSEAPTSLPVLFFDHLISPSNPYNLAIFSHWYPSPFHSPALDLPSSKPTSPSSGYTSSSHAPALARSLAEADVLLLFKTAEHWMMYHKALLFHPSSSSDILSADTPEKARDLGRKIPGFDRDIWTRYADTVVEEGNYRKFSVSHPRGQGGEGERGSQEEMGEAKNRQKALLETEGRRLVECNPNDRIWGIGFGVDDAMEHQAEWGQNRMGDALGRARDRLIAESTS